MDEPTDVDGSGNIQAALARTATRSLAVYFSRPVRLFRPTKVSGWHSLRGLATREGASLTPGYVSGLVRTQGFMVIPKHFVPPMLANALLGVVLWTTYSEVSSAIEPHVGHHPTLIAAISGACAGATQALVAAPVENVRLLIEGGTVSHSWSHAWKEVFRATSNTSMSRTENMQEIRKIRSWMKDVGDMAGKGWDGWGWGLMKDSCGFAIFFSIFEVTRRAALYTKHATIEFSRSSKTISSDSRLPQIIHGTTLVAGGVFAGLAYEMIGRPWDTFRRAVELKKATGSFRSPIVSLVDWSREEGWMSFFRDSTVSSPGQATPAGIGRFYPILRMLGKVGPWGVCFLAWEIWGPGLRP